MKFYILLLLTISSASLRAQDQYQDHEYVPEQHDLVRDFGELIAHSLLRHDDPLDGNDELSLIKVQQFENYFKSLAASKGIEKATETYLVDGFTAERVGGDVLDARRYTDFLRGQNLDEYFANPRHAHYESNHDLHVNHAEKGTHDVYKFYLTEDKSVGGHYKLKKITINNVPHRRRLRAVTDNSRLATLNLEAAIVDIAGSDLLNARKYFTNDFRFVAGAGKVLETVPFLTKIVHPVGVAKYFHAPISTRFDANNTLIFVLEQDHQRFEFRAIRAPEVQGAYRIQSAGKLAAKRRGGKKHRWSSSSSSASLSVMHETSDYVEA
ncbi:unnamed protein product [Caenorhabditis angaria]|uniref:Uncharacterized protein n=1 Tax=Caenorhabditis angaria TaxID=860376 RepID=A0A9P1IIB1_9PELO|nr:unnamed protein product [Caenorhabditis angaria]